jgi:hypothetical protein
MAYATNLQFAQRSGLGIRVIDENVGTGDNAETDFDLDNDNVIASSYTLSYAASASNSMTALTETTHYTLDAESGRIVLTGPGVTAVGTNVLFAIYTYLDNFSNSVVTDLLAAADAEIEIMTGRKWDTPTSATDYFDGNPTLAYPTTNRPYVADIEKPNSIKLKNSPVTAVNSVYFLTSPLTITSFFNYDDGTAAYTDYTDNVNSTTESPVNLFDASPGTSDIVYIGSSQKFLGLDVVLSTLGVDNGTTAIDWEYWNGTTWADITETDVNTGASIFTASGRFNWTYPYGWDKTTVNSSESLYYIRGTLTDDYSVDPIVSTFTIRDGISEVVEMRNLIERNNNLSFVGVELPTGTRNVRVDYSYGTLTTPNYITELAIMTASVKAYINLSGGSYDDATSYSLGSKSVTIGEVYVNIREVITQFKKRIEEIYAMIGKRADIAVI